MGFFDRIRSAAGAEQISRLQPPHHEARKLGPTAGQIIAKAAAIDKKVGARQTNELIGICRGLVADGIVVDAEIRWLATWLENNIECSQEWPHTVLYDRIRTALADGTVSPDEEKQLLDILKHACGAPPKHSVSGEAVAGGTEGLPYDDPAPRIEFEGRCFCVTGDFAFGPRDTVITSIEQRGGRVVGAPSGKTHFLVVGFTASTAWKHSTHGTKILRALELRGAGKPIAIVAEKHWNDHL